METLATTIQEKEIKVINIGNEDTKLSLFTADMIAYGQNPIELEKNTAINSRQCKVNSQINKLYFYRQETTKWIIVSETRLP